MKTRVCALLLVLVMLLPVLSLADTMPIQAYPDTSGTVEVNPEAPLTTAISGLFQYNFTLADGTPRAFIQYLPENLEHRRALTFVAVPDGADPAAFLEASGWKAIADQWRITIVLMVPGEGGWQADETEYSAAAYDYGQARTIYVNDDSAYYLVGYGKGANVVMAEAILNPAVYAGVAALGVDADFAAQMSASAATESANPGQMVSEVQLPVWVGSAEKSDALEAVVAYWRAANECDDFPLSSIYADEIYAPLAYEGLTFEMTGQRLSKVIVSLGERDYLAADFVDYLWSEFLYRARRQDSYAVGALRYNITPEELGMDYVNLVVDGITREFRVYVPTEVKEGKFDSVPLLFTFHGGGGNGYEFIGRSGWYKLAEERNFIMVSPTGSRSNSKFTPAATWFASDAAFFKAMYDYLTENYPIDKSRVYVTGQSQGATMSLYCAGAYPELIAASIATGTINPAGFKDVEHKGEIKVPIMISTGAKDDGLMEGGRWYPYILEYPNFWIDLYDLKASEEWGGENLSSVSGDFLNYVFVNEDNIPLFRWQHLADKVHAVIPDEMISLYDFACQFTRGADGTLYYLGQPVK